MNESQREQLAAIEAAIEAEKERGRLLSQPRGIDRGSPLASMEARRTMRQLLEQRSAQPQPPQQDYQPASVDWLQSEQVRKQAEQFQQIANDTRTARVREDFLSTANRYSPDQVYSDLIRSRQNTLENLQQDNIQRSSPPPPQRATGPDNTPIARTPRTSGANAPVLEAQAPPRTGIPSTWGAGPNLPNLPNSPISGNVPRPMTARPTGTMVAAGRSAAAPAIIGGLIDLGFSLAAGEDAGRAVAGAAGNTAGAIAGAAIGSLAGPVGIFVGGMVGSYIGGYLADRMYDAAFPPTADPGTMQPGLGPFVAEAGGNPAFIGGGRTTPYTVFYYRKHVNRSTGQLIEQSSYRTGLWGPIRGAEMRRTARSSTSDGTYYEEDFYLLHHDSSGNPAETYVGSTNNSLYSRDGAIWITSVAPGDGGSLGPSPQTPQDFNRNPRQAYPGGYQHPSNSPANDYTPNTTPQPGDRPRTDPKAIPSGYPNARNEAPPEALGGQMPTNAPANQTNPALNPSASPQPTNQEGESPQPSNYSYSHPTSEGSRLGSEGQYGQSVGDYLDNLARNNSSTHGTETSPLTAFGTGLIPGLVAATLTIPLRTGLRSGPSLNNPPGTGDQSAPQPAPTNTTPPSTGTDTPSGQCRFRDDPYSPGIDQRTQIIEQINLAIQQYQNEMLTKLDEKLGPQIPNGGISGLLGKMNNLARKTWDFLQINKVLAVLTWVGVMHNAYMLSNALSQTLFSAISNILDVFGIEDADGNALDVGQIVGNWTEEFFEGILGEPTVDGIKEGWKKFSRIYQAASNIIWSIQSITYSMMEVLEVISNYVGKIGNALKAFGVVAERAYGWMNPNANYTNNRFFNALNNTQEAIETVDMAASEVLSIQETSAELFNQKQELETALSEAEQLVGDSQTTSKTNSQSPTIETIDEQRSES